MNNWVQIGSVLANSLELFFIWLRVSLFWILRGREFHNFTASLMHVFCVRVHLPFSIILPRIQALVEVFELIEHYSDVCYSDPTVQSRLIKRLCTYLEQHNHSNYGLVKVCFLNGSVVKGADNQILTVSSDYSLYPLFTNRKFAS